MNRNIPMGLQEFLYLEGLRKQRGYTRLAEIRDSGYSVKWDGLQG